MRETTADKLHIFIIMFFLSLIMSVQGPIFTPYAAILGASSILIGIMLGTAQLTNLTGNLIAGPLIDRFGKRRFITLPLLASGILFILYGFAVSTSELLILRALNGFSLAFLIPAAMALLSGYAANSKQQGKNMAVNGILGTIASIIAPLIGGKLGSMVGYANTYFIIGIALIVTSVYTMGFIRDRQVVVVKKRLPQSLSTMQMLASPNLTVIYLTGFAVMYIHGVIIYEVPYLTVEKGLSTVTTGQLFSFMSIGTFLSLSLFFINRFDPVKRLLFGLFGMCISLFAIMNGLLALPMLLFLIGLFFGVIMPAMATALTDAVTREGHGKAFGVMSAFYSLGMVFSSLVTGIMRDVISPYFIAFLIGMTVLAIIGWAKLRTPSSAEPKGYY